MTFGQRLRKLRNNQGLTLEDMSNKFNKTKSTFSSYETGRRKPDMDLIVELASYFNVSVDYLLGRANTRKLPPNALDKKMTEIPVIGNIQAGQPVFADEHIEDYRLIAADEVSNDDYFYLKVSGDSMIGSRIQDGDYVLVRKQNFVEDGEIAVVMVNSSEATLKKVYKNNGSLILQPDNPNFKPIVVKESNARILGKVVKLETDL